MKFKPGESGNPETRFKKGQSGNPAGRPKAIADIQALAREHTPKAFKTLISIADNPKASDAARVAASREVIDRGWGKPLQANVVANMDAGSLDARPLKDLSFDEIAQRMNTVADALVEASAVICAGRDASQMSDDQIIQIIRLQKASEAVKDAFGADILTEIATDADKYLASPSKEAEHA